jgi:hypothetical protein
MKKSKLKYRLTTCKNNKEVVQYLDLKGLYKQTVRKKWQKISVRESSFVLRSMALVPNQASANKKSTLTPPRMARAIISCSVPGFKRSVQTDREKKMAEDFRATLSVQNSGCPTESDQFG